MHRMIVDDAQVYHKCVTYATYLYLLLDDAICCYYIIQYCLTNNMLGTLLLHAWRKCLECDATTYPVGLRPLRERLRNGWEVEQHQWVILRDVILGDEHH